MHRTGAGGDLTVSGRAKYKHAFAAAVRDGGELA
jgi:hypothetical protein